VNIVFSWKKKEDGAGNRGPKKGGEGKSNKKQEKVGRSKAEKNWGRKPLAGSRRRRSRSMATSSDGARTKKRKGDRGEDPKDWWDLPEK